MAETSEAAQGTEPPSIEIDPVQHSEPSPPTDPPDASTTDPITGGSPKTVKRKLDPDSPDHSKTDSSPPKKTAAPKPPDVELDDTTAGELRLRIVRDQVTTLAADKLDKLKRLHSDCVQMIGEELFLERKLAYVDYTKWIAPQPLLNQDRLDYLTMKVQSLTAPIQPTPVSTGAVQAAKPTMVERAKHEASILQRISVLRKQGLWSIKRLPKLVEPSRPKTHWDYLLDECSWMATDFEQERRWKLAGAKKISQAVQRYFREKQQRADVMEREETRRIKKQCALVAKEVQSFWKQVEKLIELRLRAQQDEKRRNVMDMHLNIIVGQTEKYSSWLMESLSSAAAEKKKAASIASGEGQDNEFVLAG